MLTTILTAASKVINSRRDLSLRQSLHLKYISDFEFLSSVDLHHVRDARLPSRVYCLRAFDDSVGL